MFAVFLYSSVVSALASVGLSRSLYAALIWQLVNLFAYIKIAETP